jgi:hypothetical protein
VAHLDSLVLKGLEAIPVQLDRLDIQDLLRLDPLDVLDHEEFPAGQLVRVHLEQRVELDLPESLDLLALDIPVGPDSPASPA